MKLMLLTLLNFSSTLLFAQLEYNFPDTAGAWRIRKYANNWPFPNEISHLRYYVNGDTTIGSNNYQKLYRGNSDPYDTNSVDYLYGYYRQEPFKVYFKNKFIGQGDYTGFSDTLEHLLYDYSMNIGDSILHYDVGNNQYYLVLQNVYYEQISGEDRLRFNFISTKPSYPDVYWIDGIGSNIGFYNFYNYFESSYLLFCFFDGQTEYPFLSGDCSMLSDSAYPKTDKYEIYPNPANDRFTIQFSEIFMGEILIFDSFGKLVYSQINNLQKTELTPGLESGIYSVVLKSDLCSGFSKLVIIK